MLVGNQLEQIPMYTARDNMANHVADHIRNIWLDNTSARVNQWEIGFSESADAVEFLRMEGFEGLFGIDFIFKWWGSDDLDIAAGELEVLWKTDINGKVGMYRSWARFANRDFARAILPTETERREANRAEFRSAFREWEKSYKMLLEKL